MSMLSPKYFLPLAATTFQLGQLVTTTGRTKTENAFCASIRKKTLQGNDMAIAAEYGEEGISVHRSSNMENMF